MAKPPSVTPQTITSPIFRIRGQVSRWRYPDPRISPENCEKLLNVNLSEFGYADSRSGYAELLSGAISGSEAIVGITQETFASTGTQQLYTTPTKVYVDNFALTGRKNITGALTLSGGNDDRYLFAFLKDKIIATDNVSAPWVWAGDYTTPTNATALTFSAGSATFTKCLSFITHRGLLLALAPVEGGTRYQTRVRWCDINSQTFIPDINRWTDINRYEVYEGGTAIVGGVDNWGQVLIAKADGIYPAYIEYDTGFIEMRLGQPRQGFHPVSKHMVARPEFVFGIAREGAYIVRPDLSVEIVTLPIQDEWNNLSQSRLQYAVPWVREVDHQVRTLVSSSGNTSGHDRILVWDWETNDVWFSEPNDNMNFATRAIKDNDEIDFLGTVNGKIAYGPTGNDDDGIGIPWEITTAPNDLGYPGIDKMIVNLDVHTRQRSGQQEATVSLIRDEGTLSNRIFTLDFESSRVWDEADSWSLTDSWPNAGNQKNSFYVNRLAKTVQARITSNAPATITGYNVTFYPVEQ